MTGAGGGTRTHTFCIDGDSGVLRIEPGGLIVYKSAGKH